MLENWMTLENHERCITEYFAKLAQIQPIQLPTNPLDLFQTLKRGRISGGPHPNVSVFEAANRILSDLVVLEAARTLLLERLAARALDLRNVRVRYLLGTENGHDLEVWEAQNMIAVGEAFNVAPSFFPSKKTKTLKKLRAATSQWKIMAFNHDASALREAEGVEIVAVDVDEAIRREHLKLGAQISGTI